MLICIQIEFELNYMATPLAGGGGGGGGGGWQLPIVAQYLVSVFFTMQVLHGVFNGRNQISWYKPFMPGKPASSATMF